MGPGRGRGIPVRVLGLRGEAPRRRLSSAEVRRASEIGFIEASKATSDLYAPADGRIEEVNPTVPAKPDLVNTNPYDAGWLFRMTVAGEEFLSPEQYVAFLEACWPLAQRLLKGQAGRPESSPPP